MPTRGLRPCVLRHVEGNQKFWKGITIHVLKIETKSLETLAKISKHNTEIN